MRLGTKGIVRNRKLSLADPVYLRRREARLPYGSQARLTTKSGPNTLVGLFEAVATSIHAR
jgi:hypothetical protein